MHGLRYIFEERLPSSDRILWTAAVLLGLLLSGTMVVQVGVKYKTKPLRHICAFIKYKGLHGLGRKSSVDDDHDDSQRRHGA